MYFPHLPDYAVPPGETLNETIECLGISRAKLAKHLGMTPQEVISLLQGHTPITSARAELLESITKVPARLWLNLQSNYDTTLARLGGQKAC